MLFSPKYDPVSGQFTVASCVLAPVLSEGLQCVSAGSRTRPSAVAALCRRDQPAVEELALSFHQLQHQVDQVTSLLESLEEEGVSRLTLFLPVSAFCLAALMSAAARPRVLDLSHNQLQKEIKSHR